jgi:hypothetical protein
MDSIGIGTLAKRVGVGNSSAFAADLARWSRPAPATDERLIARSCGRSVEKIYERPRS